MTAKIITWDWKAQPDLETIAAVVKEISQGKVIMHEMEAGGDFYAWVIADRDLSDEEAMKLWQS